MNQYCSALERGIPFTNHNDDFVTPINPKEFVVDSEKVNDLVGKISSASQEQANAVNEINISMNQVNQVIQQNSSISEETAAASQELASHAKSLRELMRSFRRYTKTAAPPAETPANKPARAQLKALPATVSVPGKVVKAVQKSANQRQIVLNDDDFGRY